MRKVAEDMFLLNGLPPNVINVYVIGNVLFGAGIRGDERRIMRPIQGGKTHVQGPLNER